MPPARHKIVFILRHTHNGIFPVRVVPLMVQRIGQVESARRTAAVTGEPAQDSGRPPAL